MEFDNKTIKNKGFTLVELIIIIAIISILAAIGVNQFSKDVEDINIVEASSFANDIKEEASYYATTSRKLPLAKTVSNIVSDRIEKVERVRSCPNTIYINTYFKLSAFPNANEQQVHSIKGTLTDSGMQWHKAGANNYIIGVSQLPVLTPCVV